MNCENAKQQLVLFVYGELSFDEEELMEQHLDGCRECSAERARLESLQDMLGEGEMEVPAGLLARCRRDLAEQVAAPPAFQRRGAGLAQLWRNWVVHPPMWLRPVGAVAMLALGFISARMLPNDSPALARMGVAQDAGPVVSRVRLVNPNESGGVRVQYEEVRQRELSGALQNDRIRALLLSAAADPNDPGLRVESIDLLKTHCSDDEVRRALLNALRTDTNSGVRLKALEGLKPYARDPDTRKVLAQVLQVDDNPGVRTQAIDMLVQNKQPEIAGVLQELLRGEQNIYVRSRIQKALSEMKASVGTF